MHCWPFELNPNTPFPRPPIPPQQISYSSPATVASSATHLSHVPNDVHAWHLSVNDTLLSIC